MSASSRGHPQDATPGATHDLIRAFEIQTAVLRRSHMQIRSWLFYSPTAAEGMTQARRCELSGALVVTQCTLLLTVRANKKLPKHHLREVKRWKTM